MSLDRDAVTTTELEDVFARVVRNTGYGGRDRALIEPYNGPRPTEAYATVHLISAQSEQHEHKTYETEPDGRFTESIRGTSWCRVVLQFFGGDAFNTGVKVRNALYAQDRLFDIIRVMGLGDIGEVQDTSANYQGKYEHRARFTVDFYANLAAEYTANYIKKVVGEIDTDGGPVPFAVEKPNLH